MNDNAEPLLLVDEHNDSRDLLIGQGDSIYLVAFDATITEVAEKAELMPGEQNELFFQTILVFFMQILIMSIVYVKMPTDDYVEPCTI
jgi:hypothetical protein